MMSQNRNEAKPPPQQGARPAAPAPVPLPPDDPRDVVRGKLLDVATDAVKRADLANAAAFLDVATRALTAVLISLDSDRARS